MLLLWVCQIPGSVGAGRGSARFDFLEQPRHGEAHKAEDRQPAEDVDEGPEGGLAAELAVDRCLGGGQRVGGSEDVSESVACAGEGVLKLPPCDGNAVEHLVLMHRGAAGEQRLGDGDSDGSADVAHEVEEAARVADLFIAQGSIGGDADGNEDKAEAEAGDQDGQKQRGGGDGESHVAKVEGGEAEDAESETEEITRIDLVGEISDDRHAADGADTTWGDDQSGGEGGVSQQFLEEEGQHDDGRVDGDPEEKNKHAADAEVSIPQQL